MITYEEALELARTRRDDLTQVFEYENAYVFSNPEDSDYIGGYNHSPVVVMKKDGKLSNMVELVVAGTGKEYGMRDI